MPRSISFSLQLPALITLVMIGGTWTQHKVVRLMFTISFVVKVLWSLFLFLFISTHVLIGMISVIATPYVLQNAISATRNTMGDGALTTYGHGSKNA
jgi:hypothetical protein